MDSNHVTNLMTFDKMYVSLQSTSYYGSTMLPALINLLCSKQCQHKPTHPTHYLYFMGCMLLTTKVNDTGMLHDEAIICL